MDSEDLASDSQLEEKTKYSWLVFHRKDLIGHHHIYVCDVEVLRYKFDNISSAKILCLIDP